MENHILCVGEASVHFVATERNCALKDAHHFQSKIGGEASLSLAIRKAHYPSAVLSKVGRDKFGETVLSRLKENGVETNAITVDPLFDTTVAFVSLYDNGRVYEKNYLNHGADRNLQEREVSLRILENVSYLWLSSYGLLSGNRSCLANFLNWSQKKGVETAFSIRDDYPMTQKENRLALHPILNKTGLLIINEKQLSAYTGLCFERFACEKLFKQFSGLKEILVVYQDTISLYTKDLKPKSVSVGAERYEDFLAAYLIGKATLTPADINLERAHAYIESSIE